MTSSSNSSQALNYDQSSWQTGKQQCTMSGNVVSEGYPLAFRMLTAQA